MALKVIKILNLWSHRILRIVNCTRALRVDDLLDQNLSTDAVAVAEFPSVMLLLWYMTLCVILHALPCLCYFESMQYATQNSVRGTDQSFFHLLPLWHQIWHFKFLMIWSLICKMKKHFVTIKWGKFWQKF